ncbi:hypothetical protein Pla144_17840 [Bythopirellula polymerisocia]|uniref:Uncharacterized protein n=1 Tax=Bythopirellula polymerisocia TaxID=2528003 RepID=A0A5C6CY38_9BACT|nr:hypothetical protein Pla144_17840 [Bythopirellula polymerisocia]
MGSGGANLSLIFMTALAPLFGHLKVGNFTPATTGCGNWRLFDKAIEFGKLFVRFRTQQATHINAGMIRFQR